MNDYDDIMRRLPPALRATAQDHGNAIVFDSLGWTQEKVATSMGLPIHEIQTHPASPGKFWVYISISGSTTHEVDDSRICS